MDKRLILAKAGSGKTYHICNSLDEKQRNIIISYTNNNVNNIEKEQNNDERAKILVISSMRRLDS